MVFTALSVSWRNNFRVNKGADVLSITGGCQQARTHKHTIQVSAYITFKDKTANIARTVVEHSVLIVFSQEGHTVVLSRPPVMCDISEKGDKTGQVDLELETLALCLNLPLLYNSPSHRSCSASRIWLTYTFRRQKKCRITKTLLLKTGYNISEGQYNSTLTVKVNMEYMSTVKDREEGKGVLKKINY